MKKGFQKIGRRLRPLLWRLQFLFKTIPDPAAVPSAYGIWLYPNDGDVTFQLYVTEGYGQFFSRFLRRQTARFTFLDVGANQGLYSILAEKNRNCLHVFAFEPVLETAELLSKNLELNGCKGVTICRKAISETSGKSTIHLKDTHSGAATLRSDVLGASDTMTIEVMDADDLSALVPKDSDRIVVKVDVEGHELTVLQQLLKSDLATRIQIIYYECDEQWVDPTMIRNLLEKNGFLTFEKIGRGTHYDVLAQR